VSEDAGIGGLSFDAFNEMRAGAGEIDYGTLSGLTDETTAADYSGPLLEVDYDALSREISADGHRFSDELNRFMAEFDARNPDPSLSPSESVSSDGSGVWDGLREGYERAQSPEQSFADKLLEKAKTFDGRVVSILVAALGIHVSTLMLTGFPLAKGGYEKGEGLRTGAGKFQDVSADLGSAGSDPGWQGPAAQSYDARNTEQQNRTNRMAELDTHLAELVQDQEAQVKQLRKQLGMNTTQFVAGFPLAFGIWAIESAPAPVAGPRCMAFQAGIAATVLGADVGFMTQQGHRSQQTGKAMQTVADGYNQIAAEAQAALPLHS